MGRRHRHLQRQAAAERKRDSVAVHAAPATKPGLTFSRRKTVPLKDGTIGYAMMPNRFDDCFRAAIATTLQVDPREVPDPKIDRRVHAGHPPEKISLDAWTLILEWLDGRGLGLVRHDRLPAKCARWIGVCPPPPGAAEFAKTVFDRRSRRAIDKSYRHDDVAVKANRFSAHCVVMSKDAVLFDPAVGLDPPPGFTRSAITRLADVEYGFSFKPTTKGAEECASESGKNRGGPGCGRGR